MSSTPVPTRRTAPTPSRIAILYQLPESWANVRSVWHALRDDPELDPCVILLPFLHPDYQWDREASARHLDEQGIPWLAWDQIDLASARIDAAIFTSPYDTTRPADYSFQALREHISFLAYVPYGLEVGGGTMNIGLQFQQPVSQGASAVFVRSASAKSMYATHCPTGDGHVIVSGHPRMDALVDLDGFSVDPALTEAISGRRAVLWNAHFSFDGDFWSTFDDLGMAILEQFAARADLALIFRPHPLLWQKLINLEIFDEAQIGTFKSELAELGVIVDERADHRHAFAASSAMITDAGSFLMEYFVTGKPVLYLENPHGPGLNEEATPLLDYYYTAQRPEQVAAFLDGLSLRGAAERDRQLSSIGEFFVDFDGGAGSRVASHLKTALTR